MTSCGRYSDRAHLGRPVRRPVPHPPDLLPRQRMGGVLGDKLGPGRNYQIPTGGQPSPIPTDPGGQAVPGGDVFGQILSELDKAIRDGRLKPVVIGPIEIPIPGQAGPATSGQPQQAPGGDILGQILRDILSGAGGQVQVPRQALMNGRARPSSEIGSRRVGMSSRATSTACNRCSTVSSAPRAADVTLNSRA